LTRNTKFGIIEPLSLHADAAGDLRALMVSDPTAAGKIFAFLEQAKRDPKVIASLTDHDFGEDRRKPYSVSKWNEYWKSGLNLWRVKLWTFPKGSIRYRIIYAYQPNTQHHYVLAIVNRSFDYDPNHAVTQRILLAYRSMGITTIH
jgi:hypothetical protein